MNDYYKTIHGWFDFEEFYDLAVSRIPDDAEMVTFLEVGSWLGKSTCYLGRIVKDSGKDILVYAVDTWKGSINEEFHQEFVEKHGGDLKHLFLENMTNGDVISHIVAMQSDSLDAATQFEDESLDMVFIDANHSEEAVRADIDAWFPKVKIGGLIGGHDYHKSWGQGVVAAVDSRFPNCHKICNSTWYHVK